MRDWSGGRSRIGGRLAACWALRRRRTPAATVDARARHQSRGECAAPGDQHPAGVELGAVATGQPAHAVVSRALCHGQTRAADWDRRGGAQTGDCALAVCHDRGRACGSDGESRVGSSREPPRLTRAARTLCVGSPWRPTRRRYRSAGVRIETVQSQGAARLRASPDRRRELGHGPTTCPDPREDGKAPGRCRCVAKNAPPLGPRRTRGPQAPTRITQEA